MKMKKILALILCALLIVSVFAACGNDAGKITDTTETTAKVEESNEPEETGGEVVEAKIVKIQLVDKEGNIIIDKEFNHEDGKSILDELKETVKVVGTESEMYGFYLDGMFLLEDESVGIMTDWNTTHTYLALYVDGEYASTGISGVTYHDGIVIKWVES